MVESSPVSGTCMTAFSKWSILFYTFYHIQDLKGNEIQGSSDDFWLSCKGGD
jgi:hypothetical protein